MKILLTTKLPTEGFTGINQHELIMPENSKFTYEELESLIHDADILIPTFDYKIDENLISKASKLRLITNFGVGFNNIDLKAAKERNIIVTNTPDPVIEPTAEHAFTLMLSICHRIAELDYKLRFEREKIEFGVMNNLGIAIYGKTLGIIGMGNIGKSVAKRASACGMKILYHNRKQLPPEVESEYKATYVSLDELLKTSDFISLHLPYTPESHHLICEETLSKTKKGAVIINTARGAHIKEADLVKYLKKGHLYGAALDVFEFEPNISEELLKLHNVVMTPHIGTGTIDGRIEMCKCCSNNINYFLNNKISLMNRVI